VRPIKHPHCKQCLTPISDWRLQLCEPCFTAKIASVEGAMWLAAQGKIAEAEVVIKEGAHRFPCDCEICQSRRVGVDERGET